VVTPADGTVAGVAAGNADFSSLVAALGLADLVATLQGPGPFTVFAPTNEAFTRLGIDLTTLPKETLQTILLYHVVPGNLNAAAVTASTSLTTAASTGTPAAPLTLKAGSRDAGFFLNGLTQIVTPNVTATNGVVHAIDSVLLPPSVLATLTVTQVVSAYPSLGLLKDAVVKAGLADTLSTDPATFTLFAPENRGFSNLLTELGAASLDAISATQLVPILRYHLLGAVTLSPAAVAAAGTKVAGLGGQIVFALDGSNLALDGRATVLYTDIVTKNGVIHVIGDVLLPSLLDIVANDAGARFDSLVASVVYADGLPAPTGVYSTALDNDAADLTLFAPDDSGFATLFSALGVSGPTGLAVGTIRAVLDAHVATERLSAAGVLAATGPIDSLSTTDDLVATNLPGRLRLNGLSVIAETDLIASNGYLHRLDSVVLPRAVRETVTRSTLLSAYPSYSVLVDAVVKAGLVGAVNTAGYTVLAPDNAAFTALLQSLGLTGLDDLEDYQLAPILRYHVLPSVQPVAALANPLSSAGGTLSVSVASGQAQLDDDVSTFYSEILTGAPAGATGLLVPINGVLLPSVADVVRTDPLFETLADAIVAAEDGNTNSIFNVFDDGSPTVTLFAPDNDAFGALVTALAPADIAALGDFQPGQLSPILFYHLISHAAGEGPIDAAAAIAASGQNVPTLGGAVAVSGSVAGGVQIDGASVELPNIYARNGIIHGVGSVLLPSITDVVTTDSRFTQLAGLITAADGDPASAPKIAAALDGPNGPSGYTLFAPSNGSIQNFLTALAATPPPSGQALTNVLLYHVLSGTEYAVDLSATDYTTLFGQDVTVGVGPFTVDGTANTNALSIEEADIFTSNGVIHVILGTGLDGVLRASPVQ
jgi:transforming growth factor-beta-induced protein